MHPKLKSNAYCVNFVDLNPRENMYKIDWYHQRIRKTYKSVSRVFQTTKLGPSLSEDEDNEIVRLL